jgi:hypothetical protein
MTKDQEAEARLLIEDYINYRKEQKRSSGTTAAEIAELAREVREAARDCAPEDMVESQRWFETELKKAIERLGVTDDRK